ncbi:MAG: dTDP-4-dehydrorhamnose reductase [Caldilineaceae bacterium]
MHVLVMGGEGQLGRALRAVFGADSSIQVSSWDLPDYDMTQPAISEQIARSEPDLVINAGAWTNVDGAEAKPESAYAANALGPKFLADGCYKCGAPLVQISTNEVFFGEEGAFFYEYDAPNPRSVYARSKAAGERAVQETHPAHFIVRIAWLYGVGGNHFPAKIISAADRHGALKVVDDEFGNPTYAVDVAFAIRDLVASERYGIYHLVNEGYTNRLGLAKTVLMNAGREHVPVDPIKMADWPRPAPSPPHSVLINQAAAAMGIRLPAWQESISSYLALDADRFAMQK